MFQQDICNITPSYFAIMTYTTMDYISFTWHFITLPGLWFFGESLVLKNYIRPVGSQKPRLKYNKVLKSPSSITISLYKKLYFQFDQLIIARLALFRLNYMLFIRSKCDWCSQVVSIIFSCAQNMSFGFNGAIHEPQNSWALSFCNL